MKKLFLFLFLVTLVSAARAQLTATVNQNSICEGVATTILVSYSDASTVYQAGNVFSVQLSNGSGSFAVPTVIGTQASAGASGTIIATIPASTPAGANYRVRVVSSAPAITGAVNTTPIEVLPVLPVPVIGNPGPLCEGSTLTLSVSNAIAGAVYSWYTPQNTVAGTGETLTLNNITLANAGTYQVFVNVNGCAQLTPGTTSVTISPAPVIQATSNSPLCAGSTLVLSASSIPGATYSWVGPNGFTSNLQSPVIVNALAAQSGTYQVFVSVNGCVADDTVNVLVQPQPPAPSLSSNSPTCAGQELLILINGNYSPGTMFTISGANGFSGNSLQPSFSIPNVTQANSGTYVVHAITNGCQSPAGLIQATVFPNPQVQASASQTTICYGQSTTLSALFGAQNLALTWSPSLGLSNATSAIVTASPQATTHYTISAYNTNTGCVGTDTVTIEVLGSGYGITGNNLVPTLGTIFLNINNPVTGAIYNWTGPNGFTATGSNVYIQQTTAANSGTYTATYQHPVCGPLTATATVQVQDLGTASGLVYHDVNNNGSQDSGEPPIANVLIQAQPGGSFASTNAAGAFSMALPVGSYTLAPVLQPNGQTATPVSATVTFTSANQTSAGHMFGLNTPPVQDLAAWISPGATPPIPGFQYVFMVGAFNAGNTTASGELHIILPSGIQAMSTSPGVAISGDTLTWTLTNLAPGQQPDFYVSVYVPASTSLGATLPLQAIVTPFLNDVYTANNSTYWNLTVVGSFDPNDKAVSLPGFVTPAQLGTSQELEYKIRFQNTGTYMAFNILVADTLDELLDVSTFQLLGTSHNCNVNVREHGILEFHFLNIMLPDSNTNEPLSHGYIQYSIKPKTTLQLGDEIKNTAHIFFDFNEAVVTNTTSTIVSLFNQVAKAKEGQLLQVYPNPNSGNATLKFTAANRAETTVSVLNLLGQEVLQLKKTTESGEVEIPVDLQNQPAGIYLIKVQQNEKVYSAKLVRQ